MNLQGKNEKPQEKSPYPSIFGGKKTPGSHSAEHTTGNKCKRVCVSCHYQASVTPHGL